MKFQINGEPAGPEVLVTHRMNPSIMSPGQGIEIGADSASAVHRDYEIPNRFGGNVDRVVLELGPPRGC